MRTVFQEGVMKRKYINGKFVTSTLLRKNSNGDTRTASKDTNYAQFYMSNEQHKMDVADVIWNLSDTMKAVGGCHDWTKNAYSEKFYDDFMDTLHNGTDFTKGEWYTMHVEKERHHLLSRCPEDVDLLDVIEMIVDCVCAGKTRSGEVRPLEISDDILKLAVQNTVKLVDEMTDVVE